MRAIQISRRYPSMSPLDVLKAGGIIQRIYMIDMAMAEVKK